MKQDFFFIRGARGLMTAFAVAALGSPPQAETPDRHVLAPLIEPFVKDDTIPGAVMLVASKDKVLDVETVGYADVATKKPMTRDTVFWIASMSKAMTATCLMMLVDEGKVSVDDPVEKYLPEFKGIRVTDPADPTHTSHPANHPILVREILSHSSGLPGGAVGNAGILDQPSLAQRVLNDAKGGLWYQPYTHYLYSNAGISTAARIVEVVSGEPFGQFEKERLFTPLGMKDTTFWPSVAEQKRLATSYQQMPNPYHLQPITLKERLTYPLEDRSRAPAVAGGLFSTADDVARFCQMFLNRGTFQGKRILSEAAVKKMTTKEAFERNYGFAWETKPDGTFLHGGAEETLMGVDPKSGVVYVFMTQVGGPWLKDEIHKIPPIFEKAVLTFGGEAASAKETTGPVEGQ
jgi:CubicO group peptidase (beta-lactamase class C family)